MSNAILAESGRPALVELLCARYYVPFVTECDTIEEATARGDSFSEYMEAAPIAVLIDGQIVRYVDELTYEWRQPRLKDLESVRKWYPAATFGETSHPRLNPVTGIEHLHAHLRGEHSGDRVPGCAACAGLPAISAEAQTPVRQNRPAPAGGGKCRCGCDADVRKGSRFLPGHDAKLKSRLVKAARAGDSHAWEELRQLGWQHFV